MDNNFNQQKVECIVNYEYIAAEADELTLRVGDVIRDVERLSGGWWRGELKGRRGMFPDNFVTVIKQGAQDTNIIKHNGPSGRCRVEFSYQPANSDELSLNVGDVLEILGQVEEGWWQGKTKSGKIGVFPSNFVAVIEPPIMSRPIMDQEAPVLPPKPVKEQCRVSFPYTAMNDDELTLAEGDIVTILSKDAPDKGWWKGELRGKIGLFPDNFVNIIPVAVPGSVDSIEPKKPDRPIVKGTLYPSLNKYTEKTASVKELTTTKLISQQKENALNKDSYKETIITHSARVDNDKFIQNEKIHTNDEHRKSTETLNSPTNEQVKKPPVPSKKSPTPTSTVSVLLSGLKSKMMPSSDRDKQKESSPSSANNSLELDKTDGATSSRLSNSNSSSLNTSGASNEGFDQVERNSILNDPRAGRVKAPRRRPPSQSLRDDTPQTIGLTNGSPNNTGSIYNNNNENEVKTTIAEKMESVKQKQREWEKHKAPWVDELKMNQAKKTTFMSDLGKSKSVTSESTTITSKTSEKSGSTDKLMEVGVEERRKESTHTVDMSKSMSAISNRISMIESSSTAEEIVSKARHSFDMNKRDSASNCSSLNTTQESTYRPTTPQQHQSPQASGRTSINSILRQQGGTSPVQCSTSNDAAVISLLNDRVTNLERLIEATTAKFTANIEDLTAKLKSETERRLALQAQLDKLAHCVTQV